MPQGRTQLHSKCIDINLHEDHIVIKSKNTNKHSSVVTFWLRRT